MKRMTEHERKHIRRMVEHAERVRRSEAEKRKLGRVLTPEELAEAIKEAKRKHPNDFEA